MHMAFRHLALLALAALAGASPLSRTSNSSVRPLVLWHGLGDSYASPGMLEFASLIEGIHDGIFVHSVYISDELDKDRQAGFLGNVNEQVELVAEQIREIPELQNGFDAIGFSQGGQFLRAYQERHAHDGPPIYNLITFGSQHMGISDLPACKPNDWICQFTHRLTRRAVYGSWAQHNSVQAQYFRDPENMEAYLETNEFLTSINNEVALSRNTSYRDNFLQLNKLVLVIFQNDKTVVPKESSWFGSVSSEDGDKQYLLSAAHAQTPLSNVPQTLGKTIIPMRLQPLYQEDWIGLRQLDERGDVVLEACEGEHMQLGDCWKPLVKEFCGGQL